MSTPDEIKKIDDVVPPPPEGPKRKRKKPLGEEADMPLNLNSMMDMMTIILVFLIKSFGSQPIQIGSDTDVPYSVAEFKPKPMTVIVLNAKGILVNNKLVAPMTGFRIDKENKKGGDSGMIINPLELALQEDARMRRTKFKDDPNLAFKGEVTIIADSKVPYRTIAEVLQTAIVNDYKSFKFAVLSSVDNMLLSGRLGVPK
jgi:biopolymer transport protein ExbD